MATGRHSGRSASILRPGVLDVYSAGLELGQASGCSNMVWSCASCVDGVSLGAIGLRVFPWGSHGTLPSSFVSQLQGVVDHARLRNKVHAQVRTPGAAEAGFCWRGPRTAISAQIVDCRIVWNRANLALAHRSRLPSCLRLLTSGGNSHAVGRTCSRAAAPPRRPCP